LSEAEHFKISLNFFPGTLLQRPDPVWKGVFLFGTRNTQGYLDNYM